MKNFFKTFRLGKLNPTTTSQSDSLSSLPNNLVVIDDGDLDITDTDPYSSSNNDQNNGGNGSGGSLTTNSMPTTPTQSDPNEYKKYEEIFQSPNLYLVDIPLEKEILDIFNLLPFQQQVLNTNLNNNENVNIEKEQLGNNLFLNLENDLTFNHLINLFKEKYQQNWYPPQILEIIVTSNFVNNSGGHGRSRKHAIFKSNNNTTTNTINVENSGNNTKVTNETMFGNSNHNNLIVIGHSHAFISFFVKLFKEQLDLFILNENIDVLNLEKYIKFPNLIEIIEILSRSHHNRLFLIKEELFPKLFNFLKFNLNILQHLICDKNVNLENLENNLKILKLNLFYFISILNNFFEIKKNLNLNILDELNLEKFIFNKNLESIKVNEKNIRIYKLLEYFINTQNNSKNGNTFIELIIEMLTTFRDTHCKQFEWNFLFHFKMIILHITKLMVHYHPFRNLFLENGGVELLVKYLGWPIEHLMIASESNSPASSSSTNLNDSFGNAFGNDQQEEQLEEEGQAFGREQQQQLEEEGRTFRIQNEREILSENLIYKRIDEYYEVNYLTLKIIIKIISKNINCLAIFVKYGLIQNIKDFGLWISYFITTPLQKISPIELEKQFLILKNNLYKNNNNNNIELNLYKIPPTPIGNNFSSKTETFPCPGFVTKINTNERIVKFFNQIRKFINLFIKSLNRKSRHLNNETNSIYSNQVLEKKCVKCLFCFFIEKHLDTITSKALSNLRNNFNDFQLYFIDTLNRLISESEVTLQLLISNQIYHILFSEYLFFYGESILQQSLKNNSLQNVDNTLQNTLQQNTQKKSDIELKLIEMTQQVIRKNILDLIKYCSTIKNRNNLEEIRKLIDILELEKENSKIVIEIGLCLLEILKRNYLMTQESLFILKAMSTLSHVIITQHTLATDLATTLQNNTLQNTQNVDNSLQNKKEEYEIARNIMLYLLDVTLTHSKSSKLCLQNHNTLETLFKIIIDPTLRHFVIVHLTQLFNCNQVDHAHEFEIIITFFTELFPYIMDNPNQSNLLLLIEMLIILQKSCRFNSKKYKIFTIPI